MGLYTTYSVIVQKMGLLGHISVFHYANMSIKVVLNELVWLGCVLGRWCNVFVRESVPEPTILAQLS